MELTHEFIEKALRIAIPGKHSALNGISTDSRSLKSGALFVALKGDSFDGGEFIPQAIAAGAGAVLCNKEAASKVTGGVTCYGVDDALHSFRRLAAAWRAEFQGPVVAVAGSVGKTTTKDLLAALLTGKWPHVLKTAGSQNGFIGIPITLMRLEPRHGAAVIEVGIDAIGAMTEHYDVVRPTTAIVTAIAEEHLEHLRDMTTVAAEECLILNRVAADGGLVVINADDPRVLTPRGARKIKFSLGTVAAEPDMLTGELSEDMCRITLAGLGCDGLVLTSPLVGKHNARNLLGAVATARGLGLSPAAIKAGLARFEASQGRSELQLLADGTLVICDYYNASPASVTAGLELAAGLHQQGTQTGRLWACLGDMLELGPDELALHRGLAGAVIAARVSHVLCFGPRMNALADELGRARFGGVVRHYDSQEALAADLAHDRRPGDTILIKGSRGMRMENVWHKISQTTPFKEG